MPLSIWWFRVWNTSNNLYSLKSCSLFLVQLKHCICHEFFCICPLPKRSLSPKLLSTWSCLDRYHVPTLSSLPECKPLESRTCVPLIPPQGLAQCYEWRCTQLSKPCSCKTMSRESQNELLYLLITKGNEEAAQILTLNLGFTPWRNRWSVGFWGMDYKSMANLMKSRQNCVRRSECLLEQVYMAGI